MSVQFEKILKQYDYYLPKELIAQKPESLRDNARLLIYQRDRGKIFYDRFADIIKYLPKNAVLVFNETKVLPARLVVYKQTGGKVRILYIGNHEGSIKILSDRALKIGSRINLNSRIFFIVESRQGKYFFLKPSFSVSKIHKILIRYGAAPIPPYIKNSPLSELELKEKYQSVFAKNFGSVAAPTASLHFTKRLLAKIKKAGFGVKFLTLHINLGTFSPLTEENFKNARLHQEYYEISRGTADFLNKVKSEGAPIIAVGTTVVRALESACADGQVLKNISGVTDIFIRENYDFKFVSGLITNFHVPKSSLLMLVSAFAGRKKILNLYKKAIDKKFKFFSFGDGMFIY